ncbi:MAG: cyclic nucleotide-binding domain-containing protein [Alphaproteobacteria bacterium]
MIGINCGGTGIVVRPTDLEALKRSALFRGSPEAERLARAAFVQTLPRGAVLFEQGTDAEFLHVILGGRVGLFAQNPGHEPTVVEVFGAGEAVLAPAALLKRPYLLDGRVTVEARIVLIPADEFRRAVSRDHKLAIAVGETLARHWRGLVIQIKDLKLRNSTQRLASHLLGMADMRAGAAVVRLGEERRLLAARLGMTPETLSRAFAALKPFGVQTRGRVVHIENITKLKAHGEYDALR